MLTVRPGEDVQAAVDAVLGGADPARVARTAREGVHLAAGTHVLRRPLRVWSAQFLTLSGEGGSTRLVPEFDGEAALDLNGVACCTVRDLLIQGGGSVGAAVLIRADRATAIRSTTANRIERVDILNVRFGVGVQIGDLADGPGQVDLTHLHDCTIAGEWTEGETKLWQAAVRAGNGVWANNLHHSGGGLQLAGCAVGLRVDASQFCLRDFACQRNGTDLHADASLFVAEGGRSENAGRLYRTGGPTRTPVAHSLRNIEWHGQQLRGPWVDFGHAGCLELTQVACRHAPTVPCIVTRSPAPHNLLLSGVSTGAAEADSVRPASNCTVDVRGWYWPA